MIKKVFFLLKKFFLVFKNENKYFQENLDFLFHKEFFRIFFFIFLFKS